VLGIYVEEFDPWIEGMTNAVVIKDGPLQGSYTCSLWGEVVHPEGAKIVGIFTSDYYADRPALTMHQFGAGKAYYLATHGNEELLAKLALQLCSEVNVQPILGVEECLEVTQRRRADGRNIYFLLNHGEISVEVLLPDAIFSSLLSGEELEGSVQVTAHDVCVLLEVRIKNT
jgi:beta-galactosidase